MGYGWYLKPCSYIVYQLKALRKKRIRFGLNFSRSLSLKIELAQSKIGNMIRRDLPEKKRSNLTFWPHKVMFEQLEKWRKAKNKVKPSNFLSRKVNGGISWMGFSEPKCCLLICWLQSKLTFKGETWRSRMQVAGVPRRNYSRRHIFALQMHETLTLEGRKQSFVAR